MSRVRLWLALFFCAAMALAVPAAADEFRPAYLQLRELDALHYDVLWKLPARDEATTLALRPVFPEGTQAITPIRSSYAEGAAVQRWRVRAEGGLLGRAIEFPKLGASRVDVLVRVERSDGSEQLARVLPQGPRFVVTASPGAFEVARTYTRLGIEHILLGVDHLLFVLALVLIVRGRRMLFATITAFTLAHSITLALAALELIRVPGPPVEATIALSIVFVAAEIAARERGREHVAAHKPWIVAFGFGLLHGLGFAGALAEVGLPGHAIPLALLGFNLGVEIGQVLFVAAVLLLAAAAQRLARGGIDRRIAVSAPAYLIGGVASYWVIERVAAFWR